eukprot:6179486-Pleurochrysis_carterae.AAC.1
MHQLCRAISRASNASCTPDQPKHYGLEVSKHTDCEPCRPRSAAAALVQMASTPQPPADGVWAQAFAVETFWNADSAPFGLHKPWHGNFLAEKSSGYAGGREISKLDRLGQLCPEVKLLCGAAQESARDQDLVNALPAQQFLKYFCAGDVQSKKTLWNNRSGV